jgi:hypothetical protein
MNYENYYVNTIIQQLFTGGRTLVWSWGAHDFKRLDETTLMFKVNARRLEGYVYIRYCFGSDTYEVLFSEYPPKFTASNECGYEILEHATIKKLENVYCDDMTYRIDNEIERIPEYRY